MRFARPDVEIVGWEEWKELALAQGLPDASAEPKRARLNARRAGQRGLGRHELRAAGENT